MSYQWYYYFYLLYKRCLSSSHSFSSNNFTNKIHIPYQWKEKKSSQGVFNLQTFESESYPTNFIDVLIYWHIRRYPSNTIWIHMQITNAPFLVQKRKSLCVWFPIDHRFDTTLSRYNNILECVIWKSFNRVSFEKSMASDKSKACYKLLRNSRIEIDLNPHIW